MLIVKFSSLVPGDLFRFLSIYERNDTPWLFIGKSEAHDNDRGLERDMRNWYNWACRIDRCSRWTESVTSECDGFPDSYVDEVELVHREDSVTCY